MANLKGGCLCGKVRYECVENPVMTAVCHCRNCQRRTSSAFALVVGIPKGSLQLEGETRVYHDRGDSGQDVLRHFCGDCGSPIRSEVMAMPELDFINAGTLDDVSSLEPEFAMWCDSAQPWVKLEAPAIRFARNPPMEP